jgi:DNA-binding transcriptional regulator YhcF (GntR family)
VQKNSLDWLKPANFFVDPYGQVPAHAQLKDQIKLACAYQGLRSGDVLPSIRTLARQLGVGDAVVRRAYRELCGVGLLRTERRKHVVAASALAAGSEASILAQASVEQCDRLIAWAGERGLSIMALGRLLQRRALVEETTSPSYVFVDICRLAAEESADKIGKAWEVRVAGLSLDDFASRLSPDVRRSSVLLVNQYLYEDVMQLVGDAPRGVFPVKMLVGKHLHRRIGRLPSRSRVLFVFLDQSSSRTARAVLGHYEHLFNSNGRFHTTTVSEIPDLARLIEARQYGLFLLSPVVWEQVPTKIKRMPAVARVIEEPDLQSLEETRVTAGVLF